MNSIINQAIVEAKLDGVGRILFSDFYFLYIYPIAPDSSYLQACLATPTTKSGGIHYVDIGTIDACVTLTGCDKCD